MFRSTWFLVGALLAAPGAALVAQRPPVRPAPQTQRIDTATTRKTPDGVVLDFQQQDLRVVLSAIAEAGGLNVSLANVPSRPVTLRMGQPASRDVSAQILRGVAESNGLTYTESGPLIRIEGTPEVTPQQQVQRALQQQQQQSQLRLYTYRLRHASAVQLAPVLMSLFIGVAGRTGQTVIQTPTGVQILNTPAGIPNINLGRAGAAGPAGAPGQPGRAAGAGGAANVLQQLLGSNALSAAASDIRIVAEESTNALLVRATAEDWALVQQIVQGVDLRPLQVLIEVTIAEVQRTHDLNVGISGAAARSTRGSSDTASFPSAASARDFVLQLTGGKGTIDYNVALSALQSRGDVRVLSLPVVIAQNNRQAVLNVGSRVPFVQISQTVPNDPTGRVQTVQYQDVGTRLTITPTINPDGYINLQVEQTNNSASSQIQFDAPVINQREATTQVFIRDGQTTVIGGLAGKTNTKTVSGIPFLSRIPLIGGFLFGNSQRNETVNELFLFLTPHVISSDEDIDRLREAVHEGSDLLKQVPVGPRFTPAADTIPVRRDSVRRDSVRRDSVRRDSIRRDSVRPVPRPDSVRRPRPDSLGAGTDSAGAASRVVRPDTVNSPRESSSAPPTPFEPSAALERFRGGGRHPERAGDDGDG